MLYLHTEEDNVKPITQQQLGLTQIRGLSHGHKRFILEARSPYTDRCPPELIDFFEEMSKLVRSSIGSPLAQVNWSSKAVFDLVRCPSMSDHPDYMCALDGIVIKENSYMQHALELDVRNAYRLEFPFGPEGARQLIDYIKQGTK